MITSLPSDTRTCLCARGFTFVELLVAMSVVAILLGMAAPSLRSLVQEMRHISQFNQLTGAMREARSAAIKIAGEVTVCASASTSSCSTDPADWNNGWIMFSDGLDGSGNSLEYDSNDELLTIAEVAEAIDISAGAIIRPAASAAQTALQFDSRGRVNWNLGTFIVCDRRGAKHARTLIIGGAGTLRSAAGDGQTAPLDASGNEVSCP